MFFCNLITVIFKQKNLLLIRYLLLFRVIRLMTNTKSVVYIIHYVFDLEFISIYFLLDKNGLLKKYFSVEFIVHEK